MRKILTWFIALFLCASSLYAGKLDFFSNMFEKPPVIGADGESSFPLKQISVFDDWAPLRDFRRGASAEDLNEKPKEIKAIPTLVSQKPLFKAISFGINRENSSMKFYFICDESKGAGKDYDLIYFDLNRDLDLTNDKPLKALDKYPGAYKPESYIIRQILFEPITITFKSPQDIDVPIEMMPSIVEYQGGYKATSFIATKAFKGDIAVNGEKFTAVLGHQYAIAGSYDNPGTSLALYYKDSSGMSSIRWWGGERLSATHKFGGKFFCFSASPTGDLLTVRPYKGDLGVFEIGAGGRKIQGMTAQGSLASSETAVMIGDKLTDGWPSPAQSCQIPVGDYLPPYLTIKYGKLSIAVSMNYHSDGSMQSRQNRREVYGFTIRKDKPYVFDFSNKPEVLFASPKKDLKIKRGEKLLVKAVMIDPKLDIMIRGLEDTTRKDNSKGYERNYSMDPKVVITRADGEAVSEGAMPFG